MRIVDFILSRFKEEHRKRNRKRILVGITGRAGSGKTTLTRRISKELKEKGIESVVYSGDWRFYLDSESRKRWLMERWKSGILQYIYAINQYQWWDFDSIFEELDSMLQGKTTRIHNAYNRKNGVKELNFDIHGIEEGVVIYENSILGGEEHFGKIDAILVVNTPDIVCLERILKKDAGRRSLCEILSRYLITTYSENIFLKELFQKCPDKIVSCDSDGEMGGYPPIQEVNTIPVPILDPKPITMKKGTIFCDLDGTLIRHVPIPSVSGDEIEVIPGSAEKLKEFQEKGYMIVLTTSRPQHKVFGIMDKLKEAGLEFDQVICDLPLGPRHLINDTKNDEIRAFAHPVSRDEGITGIHLP